MAEKKFRLRDIMNALEAEKGEKKVLSDIQDDFFSELRTYLDELKERLNELDDHTSRDSERLRRKYLEAKRMSEKLFIIRVRKVCLASIHKFSGVEGVKIDNMIDKEKEFFEDVRGLLKNMKDEVFYGSYRRETKEEKAAESEEESPDIDEDMTVPEDPVEDEIIDVPENGKGEILIHMIDDAPSFVDVGATHDLKKEDVVTLREDLAKVLISRGKARKVELG